MKKLKKYHGVISPLITPVLESGEIDDDSVEKLFDIILASEVFPFILGTTGEISSCSQASREHLAKLTGKIVNGKTTLYAGVTDNCIENIINVSKKYADWGIDVFVIHLPFFFPLTNDLMLKFFETIAKHSPMPIVIYNIKSVTHMSIPIEVIEKLSYHPNIVGLKDSERDFERAEKIAKKFKDREDFSLFMGWTSKASAALFLGFDGIIPSISNLNPGLFQSLYKAAISGNEKEAMQFQNLAEELSKLVVANKAMTQTIPELKALMNHLSICKSYVLPPLVQLTEKEKENLIKAYTSLNLNI